MEKIEQKKMLCLKILLHLGYVYKKLTTQQEMRSQKFLRAGELSENKGRNFYFLLVVKLHVDIIVDFFPGLQFDCDRDHF